MISNSHGLSEFIYTLCFGNVVYSSGSFSDLRSFALIRG